MPFDLGVRLSKGGNSNNNNMASYQQSPLELSGGRHMELIFGFILQPRKKSYP